MIFDVIGRFLRFLVCIVVGCSLGGELIFFNLFVIEIGNRWDGSYFGFEKVRIRGNGFML